ncbi:MAG: hypothetical protein KA214_04585 [Neisseriaceae bacterium]|nr:hypothetical protein [Neisseriaceae bacterium]
MFLKTIAVLTLGLTLSGCLALSPAQQAERQARYAESLRQLQVSLARQCDPIAADLMQRQPEVKTFGSPADQKAFDAQYQERVDNPVFQACYKLALQTYRQQQALADAEARERHRDFMYDSHRMFHRGPYPYYRR